jgi:hypothetical protein
MRILVTGSRTWWDEWTIRWVLGEWHQHGLLLRREETTFVFGDAHGADAMAKGAAKDNRWQYEEYAANWQRYGKYAGPRRNCNMLDTLNPAEDLVLAFRVGGEKSRGTTHCIQEARRRGIRTIVHDWPLRVGGE